MRKEVNPDMDLKKGSVPNPRPPKEIRSSGGRVDVNPDMDLTTKGIGKEVNTGGKIPESKRVAVNPNMDLSRGSASDTPIQDEKVGATMPGVGKIPTGKKAVNKAMPGMG